MKKIILVSKALLLSFLVLTFSAGSAQQGGDKDQKDRQKEKTVQKDKNAQKDKGKPGQEGKKDDKDHPAHADKDKNEHKSKGNQEKPEKDHKDRKDKDVEKGSSDEMGRGGEKDDDLKWTRENFKDRHNWKNKEKVTICHKINRTDEPPVTITVSSNALKAHMAHGDVVGTCPVTTSTRFSEGYLRTRAAYYDVVQANYEQILYSRSILDYALMRLAEARQQLALLEAANPPVITLQVRRDAVTELEANVNALRLLLEGAEELVDLMV